tara:strand:+ start:24540 stop:24686 length:147 start_codon:yes stop_codon:yes gene_type:complete
MDAGSSAAQATKHFIINHLFALHLFAKLFLTSIFLPSASRDTVDFLFS